MSGPQFFETRMGRSFYEGMMPRLVNALEKIATHMSTDTPTVKAIPAPRSAAICDELGFEFWSEHPEYPASDWQYLVANQDTRLGYWEWVAVQLEQAKDDK